MFQLRYYDNLIRLSSYSMFVQLIKYKVDSNPGIEEDRRLSGGFSLGQRDMSLNTAQRHLSLHCIETCLSTLIQTHKRQLSLYAQRPLSSYYLETCLLTSFQIQKRLLKREVSEPQFRHKREFSFESSLNPIIEVRETS